MSDSIKKYYELVEEGAFEKEVILEERPYIYESPDGGKTVYKRLIGENPAERELVDNESEIYTLEWLETYANLARQYKDASPSLLKEITNDEISVKKVCD
jgi:hypothetical protein